MKPKQKNNPAPEPRTGTSFMRGRQVRCGTKKSAQEIQDEIFRRMPADRKVELGSQLWQLAKDLVGNKINYGAHRPKTSFGQYH